MPRLLAFVKMDAKERTLTAAEVEKVLSAISSFRLNPLSRAREDAHVFEALRYGLRAQIAAAKVANVPDIVERLHAALRDKFLVSLVTPSISESSRAAAANIEPLTQAVLKAAQSTGARDGGNPIQEILTMSEHRVNEYVITPPAIYAQVRNEAAKIHVGDTLPQPEWYSSSPMRTRDSAAWKPPKIDDILAMAMGMIRPPLESLIVRNSKGSVVQTISIEQDDARICVVDAAHLRAGTKYFVHVIRFSIVEALKLRLTPHKILALIRQHFAEEPEGYRGLSPCRAQLLEIKPSHFEIVIWAPDTTVSLAAAHGISRIGKDTESLWSFEIVQIPTVRAITSVVPVDVSKLGLLASRRADGEVAREWVLYLANPSVLVPAKYVALFLSYFGLHVKSCDRNAAGRCCTLRVAEFDCRVEGDLLKWISAETERKTLWLSTQDETVENSAANVVATLAPNFKRDAHEAAVSDLKRIAASRNYADFCDFAKKCAAANPQSSEGAWILPSKATPPITSWRSTVNDPVSDYTSYRTIRYRGNALEHIKFTDEPRCRDYDLSGTYTNLIPLAASELCTPVARQIMDLEWITRVAAGNVVQAYSDYMTAYGCGTGPIVQAVKHSAIGTGGPLSAIGENPNAVCTNGAIISRMYTTSGSQAEIITGSTSRKNGASAITTIAAENEGVVAAAEDLPPPPKAIEVVKSKKLGPAPAWIKRVKASEKK